jgi:hypothetical protein
VLARSEAVGSVASLWPDGWRERFTVQVAGSGRELQRRRQLLSYNFQEGVRVAFFHSPSPPLLYLCVLRVGMACSLMLSACMCVCASVCTCVQTAVTVSISPPPD